MARGTFSFTSEVWEHDGNAAWHFISLPEPVADDIEQQFGDRAAGFGSLRVEVSIGASTWQTSLFPDRKQATYVLPVKKAVRVAEQLVAGSRADVQLSIIA